MISAVACLVGALACQDVDKALGPSSPPDGVVQSAPTVVLSLTCTMDRAAAKVACASTQSAPAKVSASVIYGATATYAIFFPYNLMKDTVAHTWAFTAYLQNLLKQSVGTLNGSTVTGLKVFVTDFHATSGTGAVSVANADGVGKLTAPNQPYFNYNQIIAPSAYSGNKLWKFNVPNSVTAVSMSILISTDFPAELNVALVPPDTSPAYFHADTNWRGMFMKRVITVAFRNGTTLADRQLAIAYVGGTLVGGVQALPGNEGLYTITIPGDASDATRNLAISRLKTLPQVDDAGPTAGGKAGYLKPVDGNMWINWSLSPDSSSFEQNWALEQISAPYAWGCNGGSADTRVALLYHAFTAGEVGANTIFGASVFGALS